MWAFSERGDAVQHLFLPIWPAEVWHVSTNGLTRAEGLGIRLIGVLAPLWDHPTGDLLALALLAVPAGLLKGCPFCAGRRDTEHSSGPVPRSWDAAGCWSGDTP